MEGYAAGGEPAMAAMAALEAAGDAVAAGLGRVMVRVACLFAAAAGAETLAAMEQDAVEASREIGLGALQLALDVQAAAEVPLPGLAGADGHWRGCREKSATTVVTMLGPVTVRRIAYRSREKGGPGPALAGRGAEPAAVRVLLAAAAARGDGVPGRVVPGSA